MATHGKARTTTIRALGNREAFRRHGFNMWAIKGTVSTFGQLSEPFKEQYKVLSINGSIAYTVLSYRTPIAWVTVGGTVIIPDVHYSVTTTHHQNLARVYL